MTDDPFAAHGISHLSASSLNLWAASPAAWMLSYPLKRRTPVGAAAHRGTAVEAGVSVGLFDMDKPLEDCQALALAKFDQLTALSGDPRRAAQREVVAPTVATALNELRQYGVPTPPAGGAHQHRVTNDLGDGLPPLLGYLDFVWEQHGLILDLKTTERVPSAISPAHARQGAVYVAGTNSACRFAYASPKRIAVYGLTDVQEHFDALRQIATRLRRFLALSKDVRELCGLIVPDVESYHWSDPKAQAARREVFGI